RRTWLLVHRHRFAVQRLALAPREHAVLRALGEGVPLARALDRAQPGDPVADWFRRWAAAGVFTAVRQAAGAPAVLRTSARATSVVGP
ncbi:MAG: hypothetical protein WBO45_18845, partial [Planctomycetota bacterium]